MASVTSSPLAFEDRGAGPAVVLLHGQPGAADNWSAVASRLEPLARVIVPDRPGYGVTASPASGMYANADAVADLLDALGVPSATIVGHSLGAGVALALAACHPARVDGLVLVSPVGTRSSVGRMDRVLAWPVVGRLTIYVGFRVARQVTSVGWLRRRLVPELVRLDAHAVERVLAPFRGTRVWRSFAVEQRALVREMPGIDARLGVIRAPTTILVGERDDLTPPEVARELRERIPGAELVTVDGAGHLLPQERPDAIVDAAVEHLGRAGAPAG